MSDEISNFLGDEKIRFHVIDSENRQRSSDWIIWESNGSFYVAVVGLSGIMKLSLHPRGTNNDGMDSQFSITRTYWEKMQSDGFAGNAPFHRWKRSALRKGNISKVASITFPTSHLHNIVPSRKFKCKKLAFPLPKVGKAFELSIFSHIFNPKLIEDNFIKQTYTPMFDYELCDGEHVSIVGKYIDFPISFDMILPTDRASSNWIGKRIEVGQRVEGAHAIVIHSWPSNGSPLLLAEINGFTLIRND